MNKFYSLIFFSLFFSISLTSDKKIKISFLEKKEKSRSRTPEKDKKNNFFDDEKKTEKKEFFLEKFNFDSPKSTKMTEEDKKRLLLAPKKDRPFKQFNF